MWLPKKKKIDVLPVEVRAMAFRVQAGILSSGSRPEDETQDRKGLGGVQGTLCCWRNTMAGYVPSPTRPIRDIGVHPSPDLAST